MTARPPRRGDPATRREIIANWLALLALLALGIVWPGEEEPGPAMRSAHTLRPPAAAGAEAPVARHALAVRALPARNIREITRSRPACARRVELG
jgi:hypothetical protein